MTAKNARQPGDDTPYSTGYHALHKRVDRTRGKARDQQCVHCDGQAAEWAQLHDTDGTDLLNDYMPLCKKCHNRYDDIASFAKSYWSEYRQNTDFGCGHPREGNTVVKGKRIRCRICINAQQRARRRRLREAVI